MDKKVLHPELSYKIIGALFDVFNELGYSYREIYYQKAIAKLFKQLNINFREQVGMPLLFKGEMIGRAVCDFLVDDKIILEIKHGDRFSVQDIKQLYTYLKAKNLKLGILARFSSKGLKFKRVLNLY